MDHAIASPAMATATAQSIPRPMSALDRLSSAQGALHQVIDELEARLGPLIGPDRDDAEMRNAPMDSPPLTAIHGAATVTEGQIARLHRLLACLEV